jgi:hypothetical protein
MQQIVPKPFMSHALILAHQSPPKCIVKTQPIIKVFLTVDTLTILSLEEWSGTEVLNLAPFR